MLYGKRFGQDGKPVEITLVQKTLSKDKPIIIEPGKNIRLDLEGKELTTDGPGYVIENYGELEIIDTSDDQTGRITSTTNSTIYNGTPTDYTDDSATVENIDMSNVQKINDSDKYYFIYDETSKKIKNTNNNQDLSLNTTATGYLELDLTEYVGKYVMEVAVDISSYSGYSSGRGYVYITDMPHKLQGGDLINVAEVQSKKATIDIAGGQKYYLSFQYSKPSNTGNYHDDEFRINSITLKKKPEGKLTLTGGTIDINKAGSSYTYYSAICNSGITNIKGGNLTSNKGNTVGISTLSGGTSNIIGGNIKLVGSNNKGVYAYEKCSLTKITGGTISAYYGIDTREFLGNVIMTGGKLASDCNRPVANEGPHSLIVMDGINIEAGNNYCVYMNYTYGDLILNGCNMTTQSTCIYNYSNSSNIQIKGSTINASLAIQIVSPDSKISITDSNITTSYGAISSYRNNKVDIKGSTITGNGNDSVLDVRSSNYTIIDSNISNISTTNSKYEAINIDGGQLNIKGKTEIKSTGVVIYSSSSANATINIESGTLTSMENKVIETNNASGIINLGVNDDNVDNEKPILKSATTPLTTHSDGMRMNFYDGQIIGGQDNIIGIPINEIADTYDLVQEKYEIEGEEENQYYVFKLGTAENEVELTKNDSEKKQYHTLQDAIKNCGSGIDEEQVTIKLLKNINISKQVKIENGQNIKIDLNGHKVYIITEDAICNEGKLEITDSMADPDNSDYNLIQRTGTTIINNASKNDEGEVSYKGDLTINDGIKINSTVTGTSNSYKKIINNEGKLNTKDIIINATGNYIYAIYNLGTMNVVDGSITTNKQYAYSIYNDGLEKATINGTKLTGDGVACAYNNSGEIEFTGTTIINSKSKAIHNNSTGTISVNKAEINCNGVTAIENYGAGIINIEDGQITQKNTSGNVILNNSTGIINVNGGTIISDVTWQYGYALYNYYNGTINVTGGTIIAKGRASYGIYNYNKGRVNVKGGNITSEQDCGIYNQSGELYLGEKINTENMQSEETPDSKNPFIQGATYGIYNKSTFYYYDGAIKGLIGKSIYGDIAEKEIGYQVVKDANDDETETATLKKVYIAQIKEEGDTGEGEKITTVTELQDKISSLNKSNNYVINVLADFNLTSDEKISIPEGVTIKLDLNGFSIASAAVPTITNNGNLTIKDSNENLLGTISSTLNGTSSLYNNLIYNGENTTLTVESGNLSVRGTYSRCIYNCETGTVDIKGGKQTVTASHSNAVYNKGKLKMSGNTISTNSDSSTAFYNESEENVSITDSIITTVNDSSSYGIYHVNAGQIEINGNTAITTSSTAIYNNNTGMIIINGGKISCSSSHAVYNHTSGTIEVKGGEIKSTYYSGSGIYNYDGGIVNLKNGTITTTGSNAYGIYNYNYNNKGTVNIEGGEVNSYSHSVYNGKSNQTGIINVTGGTIISTNQDGIYNSDGTLTVGDKIKTSEAQVEEVPDTKSPSIKGKQYGVYNCATFNFYDGEIIGGSGKSINFNITDKEKDYQIIKTADNETGLETAILQKQDVMEVDGTTYKTIEQIQNAVNNFDTTQKHTMKLLSDFYMCLEENITFLDNVNVTIDLNGKTLESSSDSTIINKGNLEITDNSDGKNGKIQGTSGKLIDNQKMLTINGGNLNTVNYNTKSYLKLINNTGTLI